MQIRVRIFSWILILCIFTLSACQATLTLEETELPSETAPPTLQVISSPTNQPVAEITPTSSPSVEPNVEVELKSTLPDEKLPPFNPFVSTGDETQSLPVITAENATDVVNLGGWGRGKIYEVDLSADGSLIAVKASTGIGLYDAQSMSEIRFLESSTDIQSLGMYDPGVYNQVEFSPDGRILAVVMQSQVYLLNALDGNLLGILEGDGENYQLMSIAFSADGELLAGSEGWSADVNIWDTQEGQLLQTWQETPTTSLTFSPDGDLLVSANGEVHKITDGTLLYKLDEEGYGVNQVMFSPDGQLLAATSGLEGRLGVWRAADGKHLYSFDTYARAVFSPDGQLITLITPSGDIQIASAANGNLVSHYKIQQPDFTVERLLAFTPDGSRLVTAASRGSITAWEVSSGKQVYRLEAHQGDVRLVQFSRDGEIMVSTDGQWLRSWRASDGMPLESLRLGYGAPFVTPDASTLVTEPAGYWTGVRVWNANDGSLRYLLEDARWPIAFSADSNLMATWEMSSDTSGWIRDSIAVRYISDGSLLVQLTDDDSELDNPVYDIAISSDGSLLATVRNYNELAVWKLPEGELLYKNDGADTFPFVNVAISPDGQYLATGNDYHKVLIWRAADGFLLRTLPMDPTDVMGESGQVSSLAFSPDGRLFAATDEGGFYQVWRVEDWSSLQHNSDFINQMWRPSVAVAYSPDGTILAIGGTGNAISLWRLDDGELLTTLRGHTDDIIRIGFSPDGKWLYSGSLDGTLKFWGIPPEQ